jgi:dipeptidyl aminopeptidase/acylaminoacyl peptidase
VDQVKIPMFVAHGTGDQNALPEESKHLIAELKKYRVPYEKLIERGEGHGFRRLDNRIELYTAIEAFLAKNMTPRAAHVAAVPVATVVR